MPRRLYTNFIILVVFCLVTIFFVITFHAWTKEILIVAVYAAITWIVHSNYVDLYRIISKGRGQKELAFTPLSEGVIITDALHRIIYINTPLEEYFRIECAQIKHQRLDSMVPELAIFFKKSNYKYNLQDLKIDSRKDEVAHLFDVQFEKLVDMENKFIGTIIILQDKTSRTEAESEVNSLIYCDSLTGLPNKAYLTQDYHNLLTSNLYIEQKYKLFTVAIHIANLQAINDTIGYQYGDAAILKFKKIVTDYLESTDMRIPQSLKLNKAFYRMSGNTFILSVSINSNKNDKSLMLVMTNFINEMMKKLSHSIVVKEETLYLQYNFGISIYPDDFKNNQGLQIVPETIFRCSEIAMSAARKKGANKYIFYSEEINDSILQKFNLENELRKGLEDNELQLLLQPQLNLADKKLRGFEALICWRREDGRVISPGTFIPILEHSGLIITVGDWILHEACRQGLELLNGGLDFKTISVNISVLQLQSENFLERMDSILAETNFPADKLEIEVTESILLDNPQRVIDILNQVKAKNIKIALDDFGTGFSSLSYLKLLPIDYLKIDKSFAFEITTTGDTRLLLAILAIAKSLNIYSIVEGVESQEQLDFLRTTSCDIIQGYYISKPLSIMEIRKLFQKTDGLG